MNILLVEDDRDLGRLIRDELQKRNYQVHWSQNFNEALEKREGEFDLAILDLNLPDGTGFDLVKPLGCPVIIMSAMSDPENRLKGVELGAMDFIPKPFLLQELFLKIDRALGEKQEAKSQWTLNGTTLDLHKRQITTSKDTHLLNKRDFRLLKILVQKAPEVVSRDEIIDYVYGKDQNPSHRTVDNAVVGIRQMLLDEDHEWIRSVRGEGYLWALKGENS
jgi:DNA-binding response OmpR family regulator